MSFVFIGTNHKKPFLLLALTLGVPLTAIIHKTLDLVQVSSRSLTANENPFKVPYHHIKLPLRSPTSSHSTSNTRT
jgi:hypothetical protein